MKKLEQYRERIFAASITEIILLMLFMVLAVASLIRVDKEKYEGALAFTLGEETLTAIDTLDIDSLETSRSLQDIKDRLELSNEEVFDEMEDLKDSLDVEKTLTDSLKTRVLLMKTTIDSLSEDSLVHKYETAMAKIDSMNLWGKLGRNAPSCSDEHGVFGPKAIFIIDLQVACPQEEDRWGNIKPGTRDCSNKSKNIYTLNVTNNPIHLQNLELIEKTPDLIGPASYRLEHSNTLLKVSGENVTLKGLNPIAERFEKVQKSRFEYDSLGKLDPLCEGPDWRKWYPSLLCKECNYYVQLTDFSMNTHTEEIKEARQYSGQLMAVFQKYFFVDQL